jgi:uncharacterized surface protein with fasciclin (FAS1) repeats
MIRELLCPVKKVTPTKMKNLIISMLIVPFFWSCGQNGGGETTAPENTSNEVEQALTPGQEGVNNGESTPNILQVAVGSADHTTLVAAVKAAEQTTALANNGPLTVFAPTNAAFDALPAGTVESLLEPENKMKLISIVQFHAAPGSYDVSQLKDGQSLFVASGHNIKVEVKDDGTYVHGAKILGTVKASNGIVHVVDKVLLPN